MSSARLMRPLCCLLLLSGLAGAGAGWASDNWNVDGEHGELHVQGELQEGACRVEMDSEFQQVDLGTVSTDALRVPGQHSTPVPFHIYLRDCLRSHGAVRSLWTGNLTWSENQPVVSVAFVAPADADNPELVHPDSVTLSGVGLRLLSDHMETVTLGRRGRPKFLDPGQDTLTFYVAPERTVAPLAPGDYRATVSFFLNYQ